MLNDISVSGAALRDAPTLPEGARLRMRVAELLPTALDAEVVGVANGILRLRFRFDPEASKSLAEALASQARKAA